MKLLFKTEFKRNLKSLLLWSGIIIGLVILMLSLYPVFQNSFSQMEELLAIFPDGFLKVFGIGGEGGLDISTAYGWYGMEGYLFVEVMRRFWDLACYPKKRTIKPLNFYYQNQFQEIRFCLERDWWY